MARKAPKNAHAHFLLGLMYQRLGQPQKVAFRRSIIILEFNLLCFAFLTKLWSCISGSDCL